MTDFNFDIPAIKSAAEKEAEQAARKLKRSRAISDKRYANRDAIHAAQQAKREANSPRVKLERLWMKNWETLSPEQQAEIEKRHLVAVQFFQEICETTQALREDRIPGVECLHGDVLYGELKGFFANEPSSTTYLDAEVAAHLSQAQFDEVIDDEPFKLYGKRTKVEGVLLTNFKKALFAWSLCHRQDCDDAVYSELETLFAKPERPPLPQPKGYQPMTRAEERGLMAHKENLEQLRRKAVVDRIGDSNVCL